MNDVRSPDSGAGGTADDGGAGASTVDAGSSSDSTLTTIGLVGRANSGKTSVVMHLTGTARRPVNFPGSSVECVECRARWEGRDLRFVDLPGIADLAAVTRDEQEALSFLQGESKIGKPDALCVVLDASKLSVELRLLREVGRLGLPLVVVLNKVDVARREGEEVDVDALSARLGVPVHVTNGLRGTGVKDLRRPLLDATQVGAGTELEDFDPEELGRAVTSAAAPGRRNITDTLDGILLHRVLGLPILAVVLYLVFQSVYTVAEPFMGWVEAGQEALAAAVESGLDPGALRAFLIDGLINGVGSVLIFLPQIALLIAIVTILEATGYMARAAYLLDRLLGRFGLSGRSFVPLATSFACAIPGILATRIIDDERDRLATILVAPLMSCSARLPVYVVLIGAFFPASWAGLVLFALYALGIVVAVLVALFLRKTVLRGGQSMLVMELPAYQPPAWRVVGRSVFSACKNFIVMAGTIIFATAIIVWALSYYPRPASIHEDFEAQRATVTADANLDESVREEVLSRLEFREHRAYFEQSYLAKIGKTIQPVFAPAGFDWRITVGVLSAFPARELIVPTLGILYSVPDVDPGGYDLTALTGEAPDGLRDRLRNAKDAEGRPVFNALVALAVMVFFALCSQCAATLGAIRRETGGWHWAAVTFGYMTGLAWLAAVAVYQVGSLFGYGLPG